MKNKMMLFSIMMTLAAATGLSQSSQKLLTGNAIFESKCAKCHGADGTKGLFGAKNLQVSRLSDTEYFNIVSNGKSIMPTWKNKLSEDQINQVIAYIKKLRK